ncbi:uncharacterized protein G2W53_005347 [Senna tora]|uniref:Uncharacterized protein n=1 Tax=Senna tora TaxID=362788 RepID=A0A834XER8_9FABA|nr:uncharacterized protein G2W53_005347 [Senna tora]
MRLKNQIHFPIVLGQPISAHSTQPSPTCASKRSKTKSLANKDINKIAPENEEERPRTYPERSVARRRFGGEEEKERARTLISSFNIEENQQLRLVAELQWCGAQGMKASVRMKKFIDYERGVVFTLRFRSLLLCGIEAEQVGQLGGTGHGSKNLVHDMRGSDFNP